MGRPRIGEKGYERANERWRQSMAKRFGGTYEARKKMQEIGSMGGRTTGIVKGFAANPSLAKLAGSIGGRKSKRGGGSAMSILDAHKDTILARIKAGDLYISIARDYDVSPNTLYNWRKKNETEEELLKEAALRTCENDG